MDNLLFLLLKVLFPGFSIILIPFSQSILFALFLMCMDNFSFCYDVMPNVDLFFLFYQIILSNTNSCIVGIVSIFQEEHKTMREFKNNLFCRCCLNQCTMDDIKSFCMSDWWTWKIKRSKHAQTTQDFWLDCI